MIHYFRILNDGNIYRLGIEGDPEEILQYLYTISTYVVFVKSSDDPHKNEKGCRMLPCGKVRCCSFEFDWANTFNKMRLREVDKRHTVLPEKEVKVKPKEVKRKRKKTNLSKS